MTDRTKNTPINPIKTEFIEKIHHNSSSQDDNDVHDVINTPDLVDSKDENLPLCRTKLINAWKRNNASANSVRTNDSGFHSKKSVNSHVNSHINERHEPPINPPIRTFLTSKLKYALDTSINKLNSNSKINLTDNDKITLNSHINTAIKNIENQIFLTSNGNRDVYLRQCSEQIYEFSNNDVVENVRFIVRCLQ